MSENYDFEEFAKKPRRKKRNGIVLAFVLVIIVCLTLGALLTALVINPMIESAENNKQEEPRAAVEEALPEASAEAEDESDVAIGGDKQQIQQYENPVIGIAENLGPAVVGVRSSIPQFSVGQAQQDVESSYGSGFVISKDGYIVTNNHVIEGAQRYTVVMNDGEEIRAELIGSDSYSDIAVLKIATDRDLTVAPIGDSDKVRVGELAVAIGSPLGQSLGGSVTVGYISAVNREVEGSMYLQTDAAINPGNSGGPLVNSEGEVIGINALKSYLAGIDESGIPISTEGIGFAIPINEAIDVAREIIENGSMERPGIGIQFYAMTQEDADLWEVPRGALVQDVTAGGPASVGGMLLNDIIIAIDGEEVKDPADVQDMVRQFAVGDTVVFRVWRENIGREIDLTLVIGDLNRITQQ